jgi:hypothetical protein
MFNYQRRTEETKETEDQILKMLSINVKERAHALSSTQNKENQLESGKS